MLAADCTQLAVIHAATYDAWLQTAGTYHCVIDPHAAAAPHVPLGQFECLKGNFSAEGAIMRCKLPGHETCWRLRKWKVNTEAPSAVHRALVAWQVQGRTVQPKPGQALADAQARLPSH